MHPVSHEIDRNWDLLVSLVEVKDLYDFPEQINFTVRDVVVCRSTFIALLVLKRNCIIFFYFPWRNHINTWPILKRLLELRRFNSDFRCHQGSEVGLVIPGARPCNIFWITWFWSCAQTFSFAMHYWRAWMPFICVALATPVARESSDLWSSNVAAFNLPFNDTRRFQEVISLVHCTTVQEIWSWVY